jgi:hypothetical protein
VILNNLATEVNLKLGSDRKIYDKTKCARTILQLLRKARAQSLIADDNYRG